jgi:hypothetical protein
MGYIQTIPRFLTTAVQIIKLDMTSIPTPPIVSANSDIFMLLCLSRSLEIFVFSRNRLRCRVTRTVCSHQLRESNRLSQPFPYSSLTPYLYRYIAIPSPHPYQYPYLSPSPQSNQSLYQLRINLCICLRNNFQIIFVEYVHCVIIQPLIY